MVSNLCESCLPQIAHNCLDLGRQAQQKELAEQQRLIQVQQEEMAELKRILAQQMAEQQRLTDENAQKERLTAQSARAREASIELASQERVRTAAAQADANVSEARRELHGAQQHESAVRAAAENAQKLMTAELQSAHSKENEAYRRATSVEEIARDKDLQFQKDAEAIRLASEQRSALALADVTAAAELRSTQIVAEKTQALETRAAEKVKEIELRSAQTIADNTQAADKRASQAIADAKAQTEVELRSAQVTIAQFAARNKMLLAATETSSEIQAAEQASQFYSKQIQDAQSQAHNLRTQIGYLETASTHAVQERDQANASLQSERANTAHKAREVQQEMTRMDTSHQTEVTTLQTRIVSQHAQLEHASEEFQRVAEKQRRTEAALQLRPTHGDDTCFACTQPRRHDCSQCANGCCTSHFAILSSLCLICQQRHKLDADAAANEKRRQQKREEDRERTRREAQVERDTALALAELDRSRRAAQEAQAELERAKKALATRDQEHEEMLLKLRQEFASVLHDRDRDISKMQCHFEAYRLATSAAAEPVLAQPEQLTRSPGVSAPLSGTAPTLSLTLSPSDNREQPELSSGSQQDPPPPIPPFPIGPSAPPQSPDPPRSPLGPSGSQGGTPGGPSGNPGGGGGGPPGGPGGNPGNGGGGLPGSPGGGPAGPPGGPPGGNPGGGGGGGGGGDDGGNDADVASHEAHHPQGGFSGHYAYINLKPLEPLPADTNELKHWTDLTIRQVASSSTDPEPCLIWIREAFNQDIPEETLIKWEPFQRLDLAIAGDIKAKVLKLRKQTGLPPFRHSMLAEIDRREQQASFVPRLLTGREMIRIVVKWVSFRNEILESYNYLDLLNIKINAKNPNQDLFAFYDEWMGKFQAVFRGAPPTFASDPKLYSSIHKHFHSQVSLAPMLRPTLMHYDLSEDSLHTGIRTYDWLVKQVARHLETSRAKFMEKTKTNDANARWAHGAAPASGGDGHEDLDDIDARWAPDAAPASGGDDQEDLEPMQAPSEEDNWEEDWDDWDPSWDEDWDGPGNGSNHSSSADRQKSEWCFAYSRGDCRGSKATPPCTRLHPKGKFPDEAVRLRNRFEASMHAAGKPLPYRITDKQLAAAVEEAEAGSSAPAPPTGNNTFKGPCRNFTTDGICRFGKRCNWFATTPNHPQ